MCDIIVSTSFGLTADMLRHVKLADFLNGHTVVFVANGATAGGIQLPAVGA